MKELTVIKIRRNKSGSTTVTGLQDNDLRLLMIVLRQARGTTELRDALGRLAEALTPMEGWGERRLMGGGTTPTSELYKQIVENN